MKSTLRSLGILLAMSCLTVSGFAQEAAHAGALRLHAIFDSDMVIQLGKDKAEAKSALNTAAPRKPSVPSKSSNASKPSVSPNVDKPFTNNFNHPDSHHSS